MKVILRLMNDAESFFKVLVWSIDSCQNVLKLLHGTNEVL